MPKIVRTPLKPFGLQVEAETPGAELESLNIPTLRDWVLEHRVVVLRGFAPKEREAYIEYATQWGELLLWKFGAILDVVVDPQAKNYLFTNGNVPHHWDGAFAEVVPFLQIFQCLAAPGSSDAGGETVFCDTTRVWHTATPEQRAAWAGTTVTYRTEKVAHYGGEIKTPLVANHPITGEMTLRFAEPPDAETAPLNPLFLEVEGNTLDKLLEHLRPKLYAADTCYVHAWQQGDYVLADNHALLHARKPFRKDAPRHLQRIHVK